MKNKATVMKQLNIKKGISVIQSKPQSMKFNYVMCNESVFNLQAMCCVYTIKIERKMWFRYSVRAGRSGNRIPVKSNFSVVVQTGPGTHPSSYKMDTGFLSLD
jgi:hypothetical protein